MLWSHGPTKLLTKKSKWPNLTYSLSLVRSMKHWISKKLFKLFIIQPKNWKLKLGSSHFTGLLWGQIWRGLLWGKTDTATPDSNGNIRALGIKRSPGKQAPLPRLQCSSAVTDSGTSYDSCFALCASVYFFSVSQVPLELRLHVTPPSLSFPAHMVKVNGSSIL